MRVKKNNCSFSTHENKYGSNELRKISHWITSNVFWLLSGRLSVACAQYGKILLLLGCQQIVYGFKQTIGIT